MIYCLFVRNQGGTLLKAAEDLSRIRALGTDIVWLLPIYPVGEKARKGRLGSPYAIKDYRAVDPRLGTMEDLKTFVNRAHELGMQVILDIVFHHTSPDSVLAQSHPEWFYHRPDGSFGNHVGDWYDIIDLDFGQKDLWKELIDTLCMWAGMVDGFRCDVGSLIPISFWEEARACVEKVHANAIWLCESVEKPFIRELRAKGLTAHSDGEMYRAFDITYDYDVTDTYYGYLTGQNTLEAHVKALQEQEVVYPADYGKLRFLENHDRPRTALLIPDSSRRMHWIAFQFMQKGTPLIYGGQEFGLCHRPSLFEKDPIEKREDTDLSGFIRRLCEIRKEAAFGEGVYTLEVAGRDQAVIRWEKEDKGLLGVFSLGEGHGPVQASVPDGIYRNLLDDSFVEAEAGVLTPGMGPMIIKWDEK